MPRVATEFLLEIADALAGPAPAGPVTLTEGGSLPSVFAVSDLAQASIGAAGGAMSSWIGLLGRDPPPAVLVDRDRASAWFAASIRPLDFSLPPVWDDIAGDYTTSDGWIRLHTNAPRHRAAALRVLGTPGTRDAVAAAVSGWNAEELESAVVGAGGAAAAMRSAGQWLLHPQGRSVGAEPLIRTERTSEAGGPAPVWRSTPELPLAGIRVLDLTRVLAGPVATRLLAGWGAEVLRIDPPDWDEPSLAPEVTLGKRCARIDLGTAAGRDRLVGLLRSADVLVHGYRPGALDRLGLGADVRDECRPGLVDVSLDAYGWTGPWRARRGFDSLVQMSAGLADAGARASGGHRPVPLPVQALDQATGYLLAASAITGLTLRRSGGGGSRWRASLARVAALLTGAGSAPGPGRSEPPTIEPDPAGPIERTVWGRARRIPAPLVVQGAPLVWSRPARPLGSDDARWEG